MKTLLAIVLCGSLVGCATIMNGSRQSVSFESEPSGANVAIAGNVVGQTPGKIELRRNASYVLVFTKEGFELSTAYASAKFDHFLEVTLGNIWNLFLGFYVDTLSGGAFELEPTQVKVILTKSKDSPRQSQGSQPSKQ
jgi:hypothetical protein